jgi:hypothetical protein
LLRAFHRIHTYPFDLNHPVFARYPAMKFGDLGAARHYAGLLTPLAARLMQARGHHVLTSPAIRTLPSGANLVCESLYRALRERGVDCGIETLHLHDETVPFEDEADLRATGDYAKLDFSARSQSRRDESEGIRFDPEQFRGRDVVFVNDINVTGAQMQSMQALISRANPRSLNWLFIVDVAPEIGRRHPALEDEINHARLAEDDELIPFLRRAELRYTGKFVARLLSFGTQRLRRIFHELDTTTRNAIREAVAQEGSYSRSVFREKIAAACGG